MPTKRAKKRRAPDQPIDNTVGYWGKSDLERNRLKQEFEQVSLCDLRPWEDNPRMNDDAIPKLMDLIKEHGFAGVIVATPDGTIRAGHTRFEAVKRLGWESIPVHWMNFPTIQAAEAYALADNKSGEWADWDHTKLAKMFKERAESEMKVFERLSGFSKNQIDWGGQAPMDPDKIKDADEIEEQFTLRVDGIKREDVEPILKAVRLIIKRRGYVAKVS